MIYRESRFCLTPCFKWYFCSCTKKSIRATIEQREQPKARAKLPRSIIIQDCGIAQTESYSGMCYLFTYLQYPQGHIALKSEVGVAYNDGFSKFDGVLDGDDAFRKVIPVHNLARKRGMLVCCGKAPRPRYFMAVIECVRNIRLWGEKRLILWWWIQKVLYRKYRRNIFRLEKKRSDINIRCYLGSTRKTGVVRLNKTCSTVLEKFNVVCSRSMMGLPDWWCAF